MTLLGLAGALLLCTFFVLPQGQAFASALLLLFRGQTIQPIVTDYAHLRGAYASLEELSKLGTLQGTIPTHLSTVSNVGAAASLAGFTPAQPASFPGAVSHTPSTLKALAPRTLTLTLQATTANAYFKSIGSNKTLPAELNGEQIIVNLPGVTLLEYVARADGGKLFVGQAGQLVVNISGNATVTQVHDDLLALPGISGGTASLVQNLSNWQSTIPLAIPTDEVGWSPTSVGGSFGGSGVILNDNTGISSAVLWQLSNGTQTLGVAGWGLKASDVQAVAASLH
jgi:hypothetical protein